MAKGLFLILIFMLLGVLLVLFQGNGVKGMMTTYLTEKGYVCEGNYCTQCTINNKPCFCQKETCTCANETIDKKMCTVKLLWREIPKD